MDDEDSNSDNIFKDILDLAEAGSSFLDENRETINRVVGNVANSARLRVNEMRPLTEVQLTDDKLIVVVEVKEASLDSVDISMKEDEMVVGYGGEKVVVEDVPDDVNLDNGDADLKNGVLTLEIPREETDNEEETEE